MFCQCLMLAAFAFLSLAHGQRCTEPDDDACAAGKACETKDPAHNVCAAARCSSGCIRGELSGLAGTCDVHFGVPYHAWDDPASDGEFNGWTTCQDAAFTAGCSSRCEVVDEQYVRQHALLMEAAAHGANLHSDRDHGHDKEHVAWRRSACPGHTVPAWMLAELKAQHEKVTVEREPRCLRGELPSVDGATPPTAVPGAASAPPRPRTQAPMDFEGDAVQVERVRASTAWLGGLSAGELWRRFYRAGLPVVLEGGVSVAWLKAQAAGLGRCCEDMIAARLKEHGRATSSGNWTVNDKVQLCHVAGISRSSCTLQAARGIGVGASGADEAILRAELPVHALLDFRDAHRTAVGLDDYGGGFGFSSWVSEEPGYALLTREGGALPTHFDQGCGGTFSVQYAGRKKWALWSPWGISDDVPAHSMCPRLELSAHRLRLLSLRARPRNAARFETELTPGNILIYPPAWFHSTHVVEGDSISAAFDFRLPPFGAVIANRSLWASPFGFERCARGPRGWRAQTKALDLALQGLSNDAHGNEL
jgi:hypothetical protein